MAGTDPVPIVELGIDDAAAGLVLSTEARWNQNEADWCFFLGRGNVFGVRDKDRLVATAALLPYSSGNAWISMVLVTADWRRRGIATALVETCLANATKLDLTSWLDATPDGAAVYGPLGFTPIMELRRLRRETPKDTGATIPPLSLGGVDGFIARDRRVMEFDRSALLIAFAARSETRVWSNGDAMAIVRNGRTARHIGPLYADTPLRALALADAIVHSETGPWLLDAVKSQGEFLTGLTSSGWTNERSFQRMRFGNAATQPPELPFAVAGPEFG